MQIVGMSVFSLLVAAFYCFLGIFLGNKRAEIAVTTVFSFAVNKLLLHTILLSSFVLVIADQI